MKDAFNTNGVKSSEFKGMIIAIVANVIISGIVFGLKRAGIEISAEEIIAIVTAGAGNSIVAGVYAHGRANIKTSLAQREPEPVVTPAPMADQSYLRDIMHAETTNDLGATQPWPKQ